MNPIQFACKIESDCGRGSNYTKAIIAMFGRNRPADEILDDEGNEVPMDDDEYIFEDEGRKRMDAQDIRSEQNFD